MAKAIYARIMRAGITGSILIRGPQQAPAEVEAIFAKNPKIHTVAILSDSEGVEDSGEVWQKPKSSEGTDG